MKLITKKKVYLLDGRAAAVNISPEAQSLQSLALTYFTRRLPLSPSRTRPPAQTPTRFVRARKGGPQESSLDWSEEQAIDSPRCSPLCTRHAGAISHCVSYVRQARRDYLARMRSDIAISLIGRVLAIGRKSADETRVPSLARRVSSRQALAFRVRAGIAHASAGMIAASHRLLLSHHESSGMRADAARRDCCLGSRWEGAACEVSWRDSGVDLEVIHRAIIYPGLLLTVMPCHHCYWQGC